MIETHGTGTSILTRIDSGCYIISESININFDDFYVNVKTKYED
jgi:hypothetical protein